MKTHVHHIALNTQDFDWYVAFFCNVFEMTIQRSDGEKPARRVWMEQGIQINETTYSPECGTRYDHLGMYVEDVAEIMQRAAKYDCKPLPNGSHWFSLPDGVRIELKTK